MVSHVGYDGYYGKISVYDSNKSRLKIFEVSPMFVHDDIKPAFNKILAKLKKEKLGCLCIYLRSCKNEVRKAIIKYGLKSGFAEVEIMDDWTAFYFSLAVQSPNYKPKNVGIIWIAFSKMCFVWYKENALAKLIYSFKFSNETNFEKLFSEITWKPNAIFSEIDSFNLLAKEAFPSCFLSPFIFSGSHQSAMIKARIMSKDPSVMDWNVQSLLFDKIIVEQDGEQILSLDSMSALPITQIVKLKNSSDPVIINERHLEPHKEYIQNQNAKSCEFTVDKNGVYIISFLEKDIIPKPLHKPILLTPKSTTKQNSQPTPLRNILPSTKNILLNNIVKTPLYKFPSKISINDDNVDAVGIDLGTSRCCAAVNRRNGIETVALDYKGERLLPSYVAYDEDHDKCGQIAINNLRLNFKSTVFDVKRIIGRSINDVDIDATWPFSLNSTNNQIFIQIMKNGNSMKIKPEEVSASLLKDIKEKCQKFQGKSLTKVVITIPAVFTESQKEATKTAAKLAGWETVELLPEPIAASFAYFIDRPIPNQSIILLFDLGGGTLDVCISRIENDEIQTISQNGDSQLGGRDFDKILMNFFQNLLVSGYGISMAKNKYKLMLECQNLKETISYNTKAALHLDEVDSTKDGIVEIKRDEFEKLTASLLTKIRNTIMTALSNAKLDSSKINIVLQVGGGSRMPMIKNLLKEIFATSEHCCAVNPDEVVALGAAYYAYSLFS